MLKPEEIKNITFEQSVFSGYKKEDVDAFLDKVYAEYSRLFKENGELVGKLKVCITKIEEYREDEKFLKSAIVNAQKLNETAMLDIESKRRETEESARKQADEMIAQAKAEAQRLMDESKNKIADFREKTTREFAAQQQESVRAFEDQKADLEAEIVAKQAELDQLKLVVSDFRAEMLKAFDEQIALLNALPAVETPVKEAILSQSEPVLDTTVEEALPEIAPLIDEPVIEEETVVEPVDEPIVEEEDDKIPDIVTEEIAPMVEEIDEDVVDDEKKPLFEDLLASDEDQISIDEVIAAQNSPVEPVAPVLNFDDEEDDVEPEKAADDEFHLFGSSPLIFPQDIPDDEEDELQPAGIKDKNAPRFKKKLKFGVDFDVKKDK